MERIIKFRAWDKNGKRMSYGCYPFYDNQFRFEVGNPLNVQLAEMNGLALMQFSGLFDSKGVEIYEKDNAKNKNYSGTVVFESGCFCLEIEYRLEKDLAPFTSSYDVGQILPLYKFGNLEVIGNLFTHPKLIK